MNTAEIVRLGSANQALKQYFLLWQCRLRQMMMRDRGGKPDDAIMPEVWLDGHEKPLGRIITVLSKRPEYSIVPELKQMVRGTHDPAIRRSKAITLFSETYYQKSAEFSDVLTSTFRPDSEGARALRQAGHCQLSFAAFNQRYDLHCKVWRLSTHNPLYQATYWHNLLFNPALPGDTLIIGFEPDWARSCADPIPGPIPGQNKSQ